MGRLISPPLISVCSLYNPSANPMTSRAGNSTDQIPLKAANWATWCYCFRRRFIKAITHTSLFTRRFRWWLAATIGTITLSVCLSITIPSVAAARRERSQLGCPPIQGNRDIYGIGIRIATYLQGVMTIFGEIYTADPKYGAYLTSVNLWFLWALIIATYFCTDKIHQHDADMLQALGNTISCINLGALLLPTGRLDLESVVTRFMKWVTFVIWQGLSRPVVPDSSRDECAYDWRLRMHKIGEEERHRRASSYPILLTAGITVPISTAVILRIVFYAAQFPWSKIEAALSRCKDAASAKKHWWLKVCGDILFIYPVGDIIALLDVVSDDGASPCIQALQIPN